MDAAQNFGGNVGVVIPENVVAILLEMATRVAHLEEVVCKQSKTVGTAEAGVILGKSARTIRQWYKLGKMPKPVSKDDENLAWERSAVEKMCSNKAKGGRPRSTT